jgi:hypothetical protein
MYHEALYLVNKKRTMKKEEKGHFSGTMLEHVQAAPSDKKKNELCLFLRHYDVFGESYLTR